MKTYRYFDSIHLSYKKPLIILSFLQLIMSLTAIFFAYFSKSTIDQAIISSSSQAFLVSAIVLSIILIIQIITSTLAPYIKLSFVTRIEHKLRRHLFKKVIKAELNQSSTYHSGDLMNHLTSDLHLVTDYALDIIPRAIFYVSRFLGALILLFILDPILSMVLVGVGILLFLGSRLILLPMKKRHQKVQESESLLRALTQESIEQIPIIKSFKMEQKVTDQLDLRQDEKYHLTMKKQRLTSLTSLSMTSFFALGYGLALIIGSIRLAEGFITFGALTALVQLVGHIQSPFSGLSQLLSHYYQMVSSTERLLSLDHFKEEDTHASPLTSFDALTLDQVDFSYGQHEVICNLSHQIKPKEIIRVTGASGSGKTTLFHLLLGLYPISKGKIFFTSNDQVYDVGPKTRHLFSYVPQGHFIFSGSIKENLLLGDKIEEDILWEALKVSCLDEDIKHLPKGLDTQLQERGRGLSEGQLQRLSLARALLRQAPILLLDEATSSLDPKTEQKVLSNIKAFTDKTVWIISHRPLPEDFCDHHIEL